MKYTGKIISLAFPDTFVRHSDESVLKLLPLLGLGKKGFVKAGHAALVLIENKTGIAEYYDFGRYITPFGYGRVRSALTDVELSIPFKAHIDSSDHLINVEEFLLWLEANPHKTHGDGRLIASVCDHIFYDKAKEYILSMQSKGSMPYKAFGKNGSNCSRIVTDTILASTNHTKIRTALLRNKLFTPSTVGNVEKSAIKNAIYEVKDGVVKKYTSSAFKENMTNYFDKNIPEAKSNPKKIVSEELQGAHFLSGIGSSAYFKLCSTSGKNIFEIRRYTECGEEDFCGIFKCLDSSFDCDIEYEFVYDSNCMYCHVHQKGKKIRFEIVK
ncbi:DUF6695 family protein [Aquimarina algicola]|uniref:Uncharacterized protein n=1 Tax=Aquimarina algicola TaxID=2589995 RepID=A0A504J9X9_9FLAO|nr:DUF6695 family protein [Aquimarina algicola]TPN83031.1 hypothetical protein FHK87_21655 [Aquimarina algicola]